MPSPKQRRVRVSKTYEPELGQMVYGNPPSEVDFNMLERSTLMESMVLVLANKATGDEKYAIHPETRTFENDTFVLNPYYWGDNDATSALPNFLHKASGFELRWYKYIGRGMSVNRRVTLAEFQAIFDECMASLAKVEEEKHVSE
jgi:hypothetical protein